MVWSQYVYEANADLDVYASDDDEFNDDTPLNIEDWEVEYSDELNMMWNTTRTLLYDAQINHNGKFCDFVEFCFKDHDTFDERVTFEYQEQTQWYEERLAHVWRNLRRSINDNRLYEKMMRGATFNDFTNFAKNYMSVY